MIQYLSKRRGHSHSYTNILYFRSILL